MLTVQVTFYVKKDRTDEFMEITKYNVLNSRKEDGVAVFNLYRVSGEDNVFVLFETYNTRHDQELHRETEHFNNWKKTVSDLLEKPYEIKILENIV